MAGVSPAPQSLGDIREAFQRLALPGSVLIGGIEYMTRREFTSLLEKSDNPGGRGAAGEMQRRYGREGTLDVPTNAAVVLERGIEGTRVFLLPKLHPAQLQLRRGVKGIGGAPVAFTGSITFSVILCFDYFWRDSRRPELPPLPTRVVAALAKKRTKLDIVFVLECTDKPSYPTKLDSLRAFHGDPTVAAATQHTLTFFLNVASGSCWLGGDHIFGGGSTIIGLHGPVPAGSPEWRNDTMADLPCIRLCEQERVFLVDLVRQEGAWACQKLESF